MQKNGGFTFFYSKYYIPDAKIYPVMMWIQIHARGAEFLFIKYVLKRVPLEAKTAPKN